MPYVDLCWPFSCWSCPPASPTPLIRGYLAAVLMLLVDLCWPFSCWSCPPASTTTGSWSRPPILSSSTPCSTSRYQRSRTVNWKRPRLCCHLFWFHNPHPLSRRLAEKRMAKRKARQIMWLLEGGGRGMGGGEPVKTTAKISMGHFHFIPSTSQFCLLLSFTYNFSWSQSMLFENFFKTFALGRNFFYNFMLLVGSKPCHTL